MGWWSGKRVLVTGGSKGIGRSFAETLAQQGASVVVAARGVAALEETVAAMKAKGGAQSTFGHVSFDVSDREAVATGCASALEQLGGLDVLVCNSGFAEPGYTHEIDPDAFQRQLDVNYLGHVNVVLALLPHFRQQKRGDICLVTSMMGFMGLYGYSAYSASKFAVVGFAQALRQELAVEGVNLTVFYPPTTETPGLERENENKPADVWQLEADNNFSFIYKPEAVAASLEKSIRKGSFEGMCGVDSWFIYTVNRMFPRFTRWMADQEVRAAIKKVQAKA